MSGSEIFSITFTLVVFSLFIIKEIIIVLENKKTAHSKKQRMDFYRHENEIAEQKRKLKEQHERLKREKEIIEEERKKNELLALQKIKKEIVVQNPYINELIEIQEPEILTIQDHERIKEFTSNYFKPENGGLQCVNYFTTLIECKTEFPGFSNYNNRGRAYFGLGDYANALNDFDEAIKLDPKLLSAFEYRAKLYEKIGDYKKAYYDKIMVIFLKWADELHFLLNMYPESTNIDFLFSLYYEGMPQNLDVPDRIAILKKIIQLSVFNADISYQAFDNFSVNEKDKILTFANSICDEYKLLFYEDLVVAYTNLIESPTKAMSPKSLSNLYVSRAMIFFHIFGNNVSAMSDFENAIELGSDNAKKWLNEIKIRENEIIAETLIDVEIGTFSIDNKKDCVLCDDELVNENATETNFIENQRFRIKKRPLITPCK